jgi:hypothetical protein
MEGGNAAYIQVCADLSTDEVRKRQLRPLGELSAAKTKATCLLLSMTTTDAAIAIGVTKSKVASVGV